MENNRKGNGIFLGIVSISTLVVAIIGATFAYFSAVTQSNEDAVNLTAYEFNLSMSVSPVYPTGATKLIPLNPGKKLTGLAENINTNLLYALNATEEQRGEVDKECIDDNGLQVCALYKVEITNTNTNPITLRGSIKTITNTASDKEDTRTSFQNLKYQSVESKSNDPGEHDFLVLGKDATMESTGEKAVGVVGLKVAEGETVDIDYIKVPAATYDEDGELVPGVGVGFVLIYLQDTAYDYDGNEVASSDVHDQSYEMGASYTGQLIYESEGGTNSGSTVSGTFNISGA